MWFTIGISAEHWHCVFRCFDSLRVTLIPYWVPGKNKAMSITRFDSLDRDGLDFSGAWKVMKGWELEWKTKFSWALEGWSCSIGPSNFIALYSILDSINRSFMLLMRIYQASHWKSHGFCGRWQNLTPKESFKNIYRGYAFQSDTQDGEEFLVWSMSMNVFLCRSTTSHVSKVVYLFCKRMFYAIE